MGEIMYADVGSQRDFDLECIIRKPNWSIPVFLHLWFIVFRVFFVSAMLQLRYVVYVSFVSDNWRRFGPIEPCSHIVRQRIKGHLLKFSKGTVHQSYWIRKPPIRLMGSGFLMQDPENHHQNHQTHHQDHRTTRVSFSYFSIFLVSGFGVGLAW